MNPKARRALRTAKETLFKVSTHAQRNTDGKVVLLPPTDASAVTLGAELQQIANGVTQPLSFFSRILQPEQSRYITFGPKILTCLTMKHFRGT